jgi:hypothetical protein
MEFKMSLPMKEQQHYLQQREREREETSGGNREEDFRGGRRGRTREVGS